MENKKYSIKPGYVLREIAGEFMAIPVSAENTSDIVVLNPVSAILWEELQAEKTIDELADVVCSKFDISKDEASADIKEFVDFLITKGVVVE